MSKTIFILFGMIAFIGPMAFAFNASSQNTTQSFCEFYPLVTSGVLLSLVFFFTSYKVHTKQKSSS